MKADHSRQTTAMVQSTSRRSTYISAGLAFMAGAALRIWMVTKFFEVNGDSRLYGGMAKNLLLHGQYAITDGSGVVHPTLIRLPGYPLFLAACFRLFGMENYFGASCIQIALELAGCGLLALFVFRISPKDYRTRAAHAALWLGALCPFSAIYAAEPLTEGLTLFCLALALWAAARFQDRPGWTSALIFTFAATYAALLRPDGALVGVALAPAVIAVLFHAQPAESTYATAIQDGKRIATAPRHRSRIAVVCLCLALAPFGLWAYRNWQVFHVLQPLAPRYATDPGEDVWPGWQRWMKTWSLDFVSTYQVYWNAPGGPLDLNTLPERAFDSPAQRSATADLVAVYEDNGEEFSPAIDARFAQLAKERIAAHPLRYYVWLPLGRVADMWLRPRVENLPIDLDWWVYKHHYAETRFSWFYVALNAFYLLLGIGGLCLRPRLWWPMLAYLLLRSAMLLSIESPEARYTLEGFPILFATGGMALGRLLAPRRQQTDPMNPV